MNPFVALHCLCRWKHVVKSYLLFPLVPFLNSEVLYSTLGLPQWLSGKRTHLNAGAAGDPGSIPGLERSPGGGQSNPLQHSCLENPRNRGVWWATVHRVTKSQTRLKQLSTHTDIHPYVISKVLNIIIELLS